MEYNSYRPQHTITYESRKHISGNYRRINLSGKEFARVIQCIFILLLPSIVASQFCDHYTVGTCTAEPGCTWNNDKCSVNEQYCGFGLQYQCNARLHCVWDPAHSACRVTTNPTSTRPVYDTIGVEGTFAVVGVGLDSLGAPEPAVEEDTAKALGAFKVHAALSAKECDLAPLCGDPDDLVHTPSVEAMLADGGLVIESRTSPPCCALRDTRKTASCQRLPAPGIETCRTHTLSNALCPGVSPDFPDFFQCGRFLRDATMRLSVTPFGAGDNNGCCQTCSCFGQFTCVGFNTQEIDTWDLCNARDANTCIPSKATCEGVRDHNGDFCEWNEPADQGEGPWNYALTGNFCQRASNKPRLWMLMYRRNGFKLELRQSRRGHIDRARVTLSNGKVYVLDPLQCLASSRPWSPRSVPKSWKYSKSAPFQANVFIDDKESGVQVSILCLRNEASGQQGVPRLNVEELVTVDEGDEVEPESLGGFCHSGAIAERSPDHRPRELHCHLPESLRDPMDYFCGKFVRGSTCRRMFCEKYWFPHFSNVDECKEALQLRGWLVGVCRAFTGTGNSQMNDFIQCTKSVENYGWEATHNHFGKPAEGTSSECISDADALPSKLRPCEDGLLIQYKAEDSDEEWVTYRAIPASMNICRAGVLFDTARHFEMFTRTVRVTQCSLPGKCLSRNACRSEPGFRVAWQVTAVAPPTSSPTLSPTSTPSQSPTLAPTVHNPDSGTNENQCPNGKVLVECLDRCLFPCDYDPTKGKPVGCGDASLPCEPGCECPEERPFEFKPTGECFSDRALCPSTSPADSEATGALTALAQQPSQVPDLSQATEVVCPGNLTHVDQPPKCAHVCGFQETLCSSFWEGSFGPPGCTCPPSLPYFDPITRDCVREVDDCSLSTQSDGLPHPTEEHSGQWACPSNLVFDSCASFCPATCFSSQEEGICIAACNPSCRCPVEFPLYDPVEGRCVKQEEECTDPKEETLECPGDTMFTECARFCPNVCQYAADPVNSNYCQPLCAPGCACPEDRPWVDLNTFECHEYRYNCPREDSHPSVTPMDPDTGLCPGDLEYKGCGSYCEKLCGSDPPEVCIAGCLPGCQCPDSKPWREPGTNKCHSTCPGNVDGQAQPPGVVVEFLALMKSPKALQRLVNRNDNLHEYLVRLLKLFLGKTIDQPDKFLGIEDLHLEKASRTAILDIHNMMYVEDAYNSPETMLQVCDFISLRLTENTKVCTDGLIQVTSIESSPINSVLVIVDILLANSEERAEVMVELNSRFMLVALQQFLELLGGAPIYQSSGENRNSVVLGAVVGIVFSSLVIVGAALHLKRRRILKPFSKSTRDTSDGCDVGVVVPQSEKHFKHDGTGEEV